MKHKRLSSREDQQKHVLNGIQGQESRCERADHENDKNPKGNICREKQSEHPGVFKQRTNCLADFCTIVVLSCEVSKGGGYCHNEKYENVIHARTPVKSSLPGGSRLTPRFLQ